MEDTIAAISTPTGEGGIAIIRVSGPRAFDVADRIFYSKRGRPSQFPTHTIHFGTIGRNGDLVDQVMLTVMRSPRTYTGEDTAEVNCHGGLLTARQVLALCLENGARIAEPGEFTKRAFLNGRLDLAQAEAVMDVISAKTARAHAAAEHALDGHLSRHIEQAREQLLSIVAHIEAHIDFPEEDIDAGTRDRWLVDTQAVICLLERLLATACDGKTLRQGISVAIVGRPNAGKSSLMNALLCEERSIVTPIPGTTRDTIEETASIRGIPLILTDTAGIREARGSIESVGIDRSRKALERSDLTLHVIDASRRFSNDDRRLAILCSTKHRLLVLNKLDLPPKLKLPDDFPPAEKVSVSATRGDGLEDLKDQIEAFGLSGDTCSTGLNVTVNERQADALRRAIEAVAAGVAELKRDAPAEIVSQQFRVGLDAVGEIVGGTATEDILRRIFSTFCIGK